MNDPREDAEFAAYVGRRSRLSLRYRDLADESPPRELDETVLSLARAAHRLKRPEGREVYVGWMTPLAFAATLVLVFTVVLQVVIQPQMIPRGASALDGQEEPGFVPAAPAPQAESKYEPVHAVRALRDEPFARDGRTAPGSVSAPGSSAKALAEANPRPAAQRASGPMTAGGAALGALASAERVSTSAPSTAVGDAPLDPKFWLAQIEQLRKSGQAVAADEQMKRFLAQYPDYFRTHPLPADTH